MSESAACLTAFIVAVVGILALFILGKRASSSGQISLKDWRDFHQYFQNSQKLSDKCFVLFAYSAFIFKTSFMGAVTAVSIAILAAAAAVCGQSPWPFIKDILIWATNLNNNTETVNIQ